MKCVFATLALNVKKVRNVTSHRNTRLSASHQYSSIIDYCIDFNKRKKKIRDKRYRLKCSVNVTEIFGY